MYQITCDGYILYDPRDDDLVVGGPKVNLEVNTTGDLSFTIYKTHPYYDKLKKMRSVFEVSDEIGVIFRGRMTNDSGDFYNSKLVDVEGAMAYFNDSTVRPYSFPEDFLDDPAYIQAAESGNVVGFFLGWLIEQHNAQVEDFQQLKLGKVTVSDPNNYITRSNTGYSTTWEEVKAKLFDSSLGGYLCIRYEKDGNYIDYLSEFELTNTQEITFGENLLDITNDSDASETYSAIIPIGGKITDEAEEQAEGASGSGEKVLTISGLPDGDITDDIVKRGDTIFSKSAVEKYGWVCAPVGQTTWDDVTEAQNLQKKGVSFLASGCMMLSESVEVTAVDLHFSDNQIRSFRIYRNVVVNSEVHGHKKAVFPLSKLEIDIQNPQNTKITVGRTKRTLTDINNDKDSETANKIEIVEKDVDENRTEISHVKNQVITQATQIINDCERIIMSALESYVETDDYEEFRQTVKSQLEIMSDAIEFNFTTTVQQITDVDGDLQEKFTQLYKYIRFSGENAITIGSGDSAITLEIDNVNGITFKRNGVQFGHWDGENFYTGNIVVEVNERAQLGNFAFVPRSDGSLAFLKVGG